MKSNIIHYILWIVKRSDKTAYYSLQEYGPEGLGYQKQDITFENKYKLKLYLDINGIKFNNFKTYNDYSGARMESYYDDKS